MPSELDGRAKVLRHLDNCSNRNRNVLALNIPVPTIEKKKTFNSAMLLLRRKLSGEPSAVDN